MGRRDALRDIANDRALSEEILTRVSDAPDVAERVVTAGPTLLGTSREGLDGAPLRTRVTPDEVRAVITGPPETSADPFAEAIVLLLGRPVLLIRNDDIDLTAVETETWRDRLAAAQAVLRTAIPSVGRIQLIGHPWLDWAGTGWVAGDEVIVTNRHVAEIFARRDADRFVFRPALAGALDARVDFREEHEVAEPAEVAVTEVLHIEDEPGPDMAFLRVRWDGSGRPPIRLATSVDEGRDVAVIGYPAKDTRTRIPHEMDRIFGNIYNVKRLAPGQLVRHTDERGLVNHDCTTLGGNSGSAVVDLASGEALALHFAGREQDRNFAVPAPVVLSRLRRLVPSAVPTRDTRPVAPPEQPPSDADLSGRDGYDPDFLAAPVAHPTLSERLDDAVAPVSGSSGGILDYTHYSVRVNRFRRLAMYVAVNIDGMAARSVPRGRDNWRLDPRVYPEFQVGNELYEHNPLDRGHLVRRLDPAWGDTFEEARAAAEDTFFYTNCAPQHQIHNQQLWLGLEDHILGNAQVHELKISVFSGPIFRDSDRRYRDILIPEDFWKVVAMVNDDTGQLSATGYVVSQRDFVQDLEFVFGPYETYQVALATIEAQTGLDFGELRTFDPFTGIEAVAARPLRTFDDILL